MRPRKGKVTNKVEIASLDAGIDWMTFYPTGEESRRRVAELVEEYQTADIEAGGKVKRAHFQGCHGWRTASAFLGSSSTDQVLITSSRSAASMSTRMRGCTGRMTRLDVQVTCCLQSPLSRFGIRSLRCSTQKNHPRPSKPPLTGWWKRSDGASIGTVARRTARRYGRVYDKGIEEKTHGEGYRWRYEVECKRGLGDVLWRDFQTAPDTVRWCYESCAAQWKRSGCSWLLPNSVTPREALTAPGSVVAPADALEEWYARTVRPTVPRYLRRYDVERLLEVLGISELAMPRRARDVLGGFYELVDDE
jgi:hypothetical protein